jgi:chitinase
MGKFHTIAVWYKNHTDDEQITWDTNQWVSYDDNDTFKQKRDFANSRCLGGLMVWAMDQADQSASNGLSPDGDVTSDQQNDAQQMSDDQQAKISCRVTDCGDKCPSGTNEVAQTNGQPGQLSTSDRCTKGKYRSVCCDDGTKMGTCKWRGFRGAGLSCIGGCADGETEVSTSTNNHSKKGDQTCNGGLQSYCCSDFKSAPSKSQLKKDAEDAAKAAAEAAAAQAALDAAAKAFCRVAVPALLAPLELLEDLIPIVGEILDIAEIAATPALIQGCVKGIEKEGKAEFKVFGKKHSLSFDKPTEKPTSTRPPKSSHTSPKTSADKSCKNKRKRANGCLKDVTLYDKGTTRLPDTTTLTCDGGRYPQACLHYSSAIHYHVGNDFNPLTCSEFVPARNFMQGGTATKKWGDEHVKQWRYWMRRNQSKPPGVKSQGCQRDEWPPQHFWQGDPGQIIRYNHLEDNTGAGQLWNSFCPEHAAFRCEPGSISVESPGGRRADTTHCKKELTIKGRSRITVDAATCSRNFSLRN